MLVIWGQCHWYAHIHILLYIHTAPRIWQPQSYTLTLYFCSRRLYIFCVSVYCRKVCTVYSTFRGRGFFFLLSPWLGGVRLKGNGCALSIRWNYRCVRGVCAFFPPAVSHEVTSCGCELHGSALYGYGGGFLTAAALLGNKQGRGRGRGTIFSLLAPLSILHRPLLNPARFPRIWRLRIGLSIVR